MNSKDKSPKRDMIRVRNHSSTNGYLILGEGEKVESRGDLRLCAIVIERAGIITPMDK
jgi:hypothetical protein